VAGRTPAEAVRAFLDPIQQALACIAPGKITVSGGGLNPVLGKQYSWGLNNGAGAELLSDGPDLTLFAAMYWKLIEDDRDGYGPLRISTLGYEYSLVTGTNTELWALHWHPAGRSWEKRPHLHLGDVLLTDASPVDSKTHLPTGRMTFENAIRWAVGSRAMPMHEDWEGRLALAEAPHILHRSWSGDPVVEV
jgi:hypothetical protein